GLGGGAAIADGVGLLRAGGAAAGEGRDHATGIDVAHDVAAGAGDVEAAGAIGREAEREADGCARRRAAIAAGAAAAVAGDGLDGGTDIVGRRRHGGGAGEAARDQLPVAARRVRDGERRRTAGKRLRTADARG